MKFFLLFFLIISFKLSAAHEYLYKPDELTKQINQNSRFYSYLYKGEVVFHVEKYLLPLVESIRLEAKRQNCYLKRKSKKTSIYYSSKKISRKFKVGPPNNENFLKEQRSKQAIDINPKHLKISFSKKDFFSPTVYTLQIINSKKIFTIDKLIYHFIEGIKEQASYQKNLIHFSFSNFFLYRKGKKVAYEEIFSFSDINIPMAAVIVD